MGDIFDIVGGGTPPAADAGNFSNAGTAHAWLTPADLSGYKKKLISHGARDLSAKGMAASSAKLMPAGSVLFTSRAPIGYVAIADGEISTNQGFKSFILPDDFDPSYVYYYLKSIRNLAESRGTGTTFKELSGAATKELPFVIAPLAEQKRIAQKLDALLAQVDTLKARIDAIPALLKRFRASVLSAACRDSDSAGLSGRGVLQIPLREAISEPLRNGKSVTDGDGLPVLRLSSLKASGIDFRDSKKGDWKELDASRFLVKTGDFLVSRGNGSKDLVGRGGLVPDCNEPMAFPDTMIRVRADNSKLLGEFLCLVWNDHGIRMQIESLARTTAGIWKISQGDLEAVRIPLPSVAKQKEIVRRVEQLFAYADQLETKVAAAQQRINALTQSLLAKAFRGELVPQDPAAEPASVLLDRIRAQRAATPKPKRGRKAATS
ncbi:restriction endonuclease subunit S [Xanthomonas oryzae]|uniref:restriction endonuclease subunit S n=1 Tax=Xanthomonas oryzae TaxID=347 RepID=UPI001EED242A|nr:restriction endonuclease subunit S [Xanthomonas oryzae]WDN22946.1 restriction endonuclease subunit S [Xanthomonas oryzae]